MITTRYALCAIRVIRDADENRMTVVDILEEIGSPVFPIVLPRASFVWVLTRDEQDQQVHQGSIVVTQREQELGRFTINVDFQESMYTRFIAVVGGLVIPQAGRVNVQFEISQVVSATYCIDARAVPRLVAQQAAPGGPAPVEGAGGALAI